MRWACARHVHGQSIFERAGLLPRASGGCHTVRQHSYQLELQISGPRMS